MAKVNKPISNIPQVTEAPPPIKVEGNERATKLVAEMLAGKVGLDKVFDFDDKAYDIGILDKAFIAVPRLTKEARQFAQRQRIRVFEVKQLEPSGRGEVNSMSYY